MEEKLRDMNEMQIGVSVLSHGLPLGSDVLSGEEADEWAMRINDDLAAEIIEQLACPSFERELIYHGNVERLFGLQEL